MRCLRGVERLGVEFDPVGVVGLGGTQLGVVRPSTSARLSAIAPRCSSTSRQRGASSWLRRASVEAASLRKQRRGGSSRLAHSSRAACLVSARRADLGGRHPRRTRARRRVHPDPLPPHGLGKGTVKHGVDASDRSWSKWTVVSPSCPKEVGVEVVDVRSGELGQVEVAEVRLEVALHDRGPSAAISAMRRSLGASDSPAQGDASRPRTPSEKLGSARRTSGTTPRASRAAPQNNIGESVGGSPRCECARRRAGSDSENRCRIAPSGRPKTGEQKIAGGGQPIVIAEATIETERSSRYLVQLCQHVSRLGRAQAKMRADVEWSEDRGLTLRAAAGVLTLRAEAPDEDSLRLIVRRVTDRLERIGRRDQLKVSWTPAPSAGQETDRIPAGATEGTSGPTLGGRVSGSDNQARGGKHLPHD